VVLVSTRVKSCVDGAVSIQKIVVVCYMNCFCAKEFKKHYTQIIPRRKSL
jgi:hypothetical protein